MPTGGPRAIPIRDARLHPPVPYFGVVRRDGPLSLLSASTAPVTTVVAPAGYGKSTLLAQWVERQPEPVGWLAVDVTDNDPAVLCTSVAAALDRVRPLDPEVVAALESRRAPATYVGPLLRVIDGLDGPVTLVIDQLECVTNPECLDIVAQVASRLPEHIRLVLSSRVTPRLQTARLRVEGRLAELGAEDLAFDIREATEMLVAAGVDIGEVDVPELVGRTEGWPAGLYLAAVASHVGTTSALAARAVSGDSRTIGDYLRTEILDQLTPADASFLIETSVLETLQGALCDATLEVTGSAERLVEFERRNLMLVPLDDRRESYRYHRLFGELLRSELDRRAPERVPQLHARAAAWFEANGRLEQALHHAMAANDADRVAALLTDLVQPVWASGRAETAMGWLEWLADRELLGDYPSLTVHGSLMYALLGYPAKAEAWADAAKRADPGTDPSDGNSMESLLAYLRAFLCRDGVATMRADSVLAYDGLNPTSPYRASMLFTEGLSYVLDRDPAAAEPVLVRAHDAAMAVGSAPVAAMVSATLGQIAADRDDWTEASAMGDRALAVLGDETYDEYWTSALVFAWNARVAVHAGRIDTAQTLLARAVRLRPLLTYALPVVSVLALLDAARVYIALADADGAQAVLRQAVGILQQRESLGVLGPQVDELRRQLAFQPVTLGGGSGLTAAELRLAPFLATHLSLQEIGERLYISRSTAKTHALAIYRKVGATSRSEAVDRLVESGLIVG